VPISAPFLSYGEAGIDYDGTSIAFAEHDCTDGYRVLTDDVDRAIANGPYRVGSCPASVEVLGRPLDRNDRLRVRITCPQGCFGGLVVRAPRHRLQTARDPLVRVAPGASGITTLRLSREERRKTHRHRRVAAQIVAFVLQPDGTTRRFKRDFTLRFRR
jgi:hypothetical protein